MNLKFLFFLASFLFVGLMVPKYSVILLLLLLLILAKPNVIFFKENLLLFLFLITYFSIGVFLGEHEPLRSVYNIIIIQSGYYLGVCTNWKELPYWPYNSFYAIIAFSLGFLLFSSFSFYFTFSANPFLIYQRTVLNIWNNEIMAPLALCYFTSPLIALIPTATYAVSRFQLKDIGQLRNMLNLLLLVVLILLGVYGLFMNVILQNRTALTIFIFSSAFAVIYLLLHQKQLSNLKMVFLSLVIIIILYFYGIIFYEINIIKEAYEYLFEERGLETTRYALWMDGIYNLFQYPLGGGKIDSVHMTEWFHNLWLDVIKFSGVVPLVFLLIFQSMHLKSIYLILKRSQNNFVSLFIISLLIYIFNTYLVEPVLEASVITFTFTLFIFGIIRNIGHNISASQYSP